MNYFDDVSDFHQKMGLPVSAESVISSQVSQPPAILKESDFQFRLAFLYEELRELIEGQTNQNLAQVSDALVDIVYVALGTAHYAGIPFNALWEEVHRSNMTKRPWKEGDPIKPRNTIGLEIVKPEGWKPPDINGTLIEFATVFGFSLKLRFPYESEGELKGFYGSSDE